MLRGGNLTGGGSRGVIRYQLDYLGIKPFRRGAARDARACACAAAIFLRARSARRVQRRARRRVPRVPLPPPRRGRARSARARERRRVRRAAAARRSESVTRRVALALKGLVASSQRSADRGEPRVARQPRIFATAKRVTGGGRRGRAVTTAQLTRARTRRYTSGNAAHKDCFP